MTDKLTLYNLALKKLRERRLLTLSDTRKERRELDAVYNSVVLYCLGQGLWRFAKRVVQIDQSTTLTPAFGYNSAFNIPNDWISTVVISTSPNLDPPLLQYAEETGFWYANATPIYVSFISSDPLYGFNLGAWPGTFEDYVADRLSVIAGPDITDNTEIIELCEKREQASRRRAKAKDAMNDPPGMPPVPFLVRARRGAFGPGGLWFGSGGSGGTGEN
jgi:hypothetical protein